MKLPSTPSALAGPEPILDSINLKFGDIVHRLDDSMRQEQSVNRNSSSHPATEIREFLATGHHSEFASQWPGDNWLEKLNGRDRDLRASLISEIERIVPASIAKSVKPTSGQEARRWTREKVAPMVNGLFTTSEREAVLLLLEGSVVFVDDGSIRSIILGRDTELHTAWVLANMFVQSKTGRPFSNEAPNVVGLQESSKCYVSMAYFEQNDPFSDFVVHEAAHVFHNVKRVSAGLPVRGRCEWLLPIAFQHRETFAYACEAFSRLSEKARTKSERQSLVKRLLSAPPPCDERVDTRLYHAILDEAARSRNGWKVILRCCSEPAS